MIITGGLRVPMDFVKAMALGADGVAISNSLCSRWLCGGGGRMCNTNNQLPSRHRGSKKPTYASS
ncbi:glutamate synthase-related protein [Vibrio lentus]|nr:glutamate synthase-related protein [Vibrio lentus]